MLPEKTIDRAQGRWDRILPQLGVASTFLVNKHGPCPVCGGKDRFRFDDKDSHGTFICSRCGAGDGIKLLMLLHGWDWPTAAREVDQVLGVDTAQPRPAAPVRDKRPPEEIHAEVAATWRGGQRLTPDDPAGLYLTSRLGRFVYSNALKFHPAAPLGKGTHPAMLSAFVDQHGDIAGLQRTFLTLDGRKATGMKDTRMTMGKLPGGGAVRLVRLEPRDAVLGIAEGVETAMAATILHGVPTWAALNEGRMQEWLPPTGIRSVVIFSDNDANKVGQCAAFTLAKRLEGLMIKTQVVIATAKDFNDDLMNERGSA